MIPGGMTAWWYLLECNNAVAILLWSEMMQCAWSYPSEMTRPCPNKALNIADENKPQP